MKILIGLFSFSLLTALLTPSAHAAQGTGLGLTLGSPNGVTGRTWFSDENSLAYGAGWGLLEGNKFQVYADYLWNRPHTFEINGEPFALFFGGGVGIRGKSGKNDGEVVFGPRLPVGMSYLFADPSLELYALGAVNVGIIPSSDVYLDVHVGARFYLF